MPPASGARLALLVAVAMPPLETGCHGGRANGKTAGLGVTAPLPLASAVEAAAGDVAVVADAAAPLDPIRGFFEALPVPGHPDAWLSLPTGASERRPVVVVIHGSGDRPDWQCGGWRHATDGLAFIVCPTGAYSPSSSTKKDARYTHSGGAPLLAHIDATLSALALRYPSHADTSAPVLAGFSLGAWEVLALAAQNPARFPRVALVEGGWDGWADARTAAFLDGGGQRVLFGCGERACEAAARATAKKLGRRGLGARVVFAAADHTFDPPLEDAVHGELTWFVEGDARWARLIGPP